MILFHIVSDGVRKHLNWYWFEDLKTVSGHTTVYKSTGQTSILVESA